jgi:DNA-binding Lrp family transcriptional regulator
MFFTNHGHVLMCLSRNKSLRLRDMAALIGITERAVHKIITDLESAGIIKRYRNGRCNEYEIALDKPLRHPLEAHCTVGELIDLVMEHENAPSELPIRDA